MSQRKMVHMASFSQQFRGRPGGEFRWNMGLETFAEYEKNIG